MDRSRAQACWRGVVSDDPVAVISATQSAPADLRSTSQKTAAIKAAFLFNPSQPTSLLYRPRPEGGYELVGAMYTVPKRDTEAQLEKRVPLSVAQWHRHINLCFPKKGTELSKVDWTKLGPKGSIDTKTACDAAAGRFYPQLFGWMVHVYPWEADPSKVWAHAM